jgi:hypothetical protein
MAASDLTESEAQLIISIRPCLQGWAQKKAAGQALLSQLSNASLSRTYLADSAMWGALCGTGVAGLVGLKLETKIRGLHTKLARAVSELRDCHSSLAGIADSLNSMLNDGAGESSTEVAGGYALADVASAAASVCAMMARALDAATAIVNDLSDCTDRDRLVLYAAAWMMQPFVDKQQWHELASVCTELERKLS